MANAATAELVHGPPRAARLAGILWLSAAVPTIGGLALIAMSLAAALPPSYGFPGFTALFSATFGTVGGIVLARRPGNRVALVLMAVGIIAGVLTLATGYADRGLVAAPGSLPFAPFAAWLMAWIWLPLVVLAGPVLLSIFPDGTALSWRWRLGTWVAVATGGLASVLLALRSGPLENFPTQDNPIGVLDPALTEVLRPLVFGPMTATIVLAAVSLFIRYRRSDPERQHQLKWIAVAAAVFGLASPLGFTAGKPGQVIFIVALCGVPVAAGIAVLRYRLYDVDTIINRAIVYGLLTGLIAGVYAASVGLVQRLTQGVGASSEAGLVMTTLVIVTTFTPVKNRLQSVVDRRFKEHVDVQGRTSAFLDAIRSRISPLDERRVLARFLDVAVKATNALDGRLDLDVGDEPTWTVRSAPEPAAEPLEASTFAATRAGTSVRVTLYRRQRAPALPERDRDVLGRALSSLLEELG
jgi:hypothetical protein